ncbi:MAG: type 4a pilus biogenesis protein PilO [Candidatus Staskawiczbacteria bacterium]|nr:type 4a pilus biogenesis protein PilO [Candidatus Staskawiczbacteria bacterium]MBI3337175.1 type 4a pilus biogenesis protein PilO [Candidatus Staskawiczbacteria bacterium]
MAVDRPITIAVIIFIIILLMYFFVAPKYYEFRDFQVKLGNAQAEYNGKFAYYSEVVRIFSELENSKESLDKIENAIPLKSQLADLIYFFQQKSTESGLIAKSILLTKFSPVTSESNMKEIVFSLDLLGNYQSLKNFLSLIEGSSRLFEVNNIFFGSQATNQPPTTPISQPLPANASLAQESYSFRLEIKTHSY